MLTFHNTCEHNYGRRVVNRICIIGVPYYCPGEDSMMLHAQDRGYVLAIELGRLGRW